jgi:large subunit ribosomal protein L29
MDTVDLQQEEKELRAQLFKLRFQTAAGQLESASRMRSVRRDIARILTILGEREREEPSKQMPGQS